MKAGLLSHLASFLTPDTSGNIVHANPPAQFDNTGKLATTGFVQRALGNFQAQVTTNAASTVLTAADTGKTISPAAANFFVSLPAASAVPAGASIRIQPSGNGTLNVGGGGSMVVGAGGSNAVTSLPLNGGDVVCISDGSTYWFVSGSNTLAYQGGFFASLSNNGYQKLPSGLIIQWRNDNYAVTAGAQLSVNPVFPIAFPNYLLQYLPVLGGVTGVNTNTFVSLGTTTKTYGGAYINSASAQTVSIISLAIGY